MRRVHHLVEPHTAGTSRSRHNRRFAFSLVELLVVIGVIAVLIGLLMPVLGRARESANRTACMSNMRQLAAGLLQYAADNRGYFPRPSQNIVYSNEDWIYYQFGRDPSLGRLVPYCGVPRPDRPGVYRCPSDDPTTHLWYWTDPINNKVRFNYPFSYSVNYAMCKLPGRPLLKVTQVRLSATKILVVDESSDTIDDGAWAWAEQNGIDGNVLSRRHERRGAERPFARDEASTTARGNVAFCDAHVEYLTRGDSFSACHFDPFFH
jgi:prepilin-type processing-associated H-X9-DG protein